MTNTALREHVTSIGFALTLSKAMIDLLVTLDHFDGNFSKMAEWEGKTGVRHFGSYIATSRALEERGLMTRVHKYVYRGVGRHRQRYNDIEASRHKLTRAGKLTVSLLKEAGLYQERFTELGLDKIAEEATA